MYVCRPTRQTRRVQGTAGNLITDLGKIWEAPRLQMSHRRWESNANPRLQEIAVSERRARDHRNYIL